MKANPAAPDISVVKLPQFVWWVIWGALQASVIVYYFVFGSIFNPANPLVELDSSLWLLVFVPLAASAALRWLAIPATKHAQLVFVLFIAGMAMAEGTCLAGLLLFPQHRLDIFLWSALGIFQFAPFFARPDFKVSRRNPDPNVDHAS